jgi:hypothetical protein
MVFYGSEFYVLNHGNISEDKISDIIDVLINEYRDMYFKGNIDYLAKLDARWCIFYTPDDIPKYFYCFTIVEFEDSKHLNHFKIKNPDLYQQLIESGFTIKIKEIESRIYD